ncbi:MAG: hypothetical protein M5U12_31705 [Verrucomicrobia bacterium]|nr:hypothetical protein [Verrucomicrobiota bacterium]
MNIHIGEIQSRIRLEDRPAGLRPEDVAFILRLVREELDRERRTNDERNYQRNVSDGPASPSSP